MRGKTPTAGTSSVPSDAILLELHQARDLASKSNPDTKRRREPSVASPSSYFVIACSTFTPLSHLDSIHFARISQITRKLLLSRNSTSSNKIAATHQPPSQAKCERAPLLASEPACTPQASVTFRR